MHVQFCFFLKLPNCFPEGWEGFFLHQQLNFLSSHRAIEIVYFILSWVVVVCVFWGVAPRHLSFQIDVCRVTVSPCNSFGFCRLCSDFSCFISNIGNIFLLLSLSVLLEINYISLFKEQLCFIDFLCCFSILNFRISALYYSFLLCLFCSFSWVLRWTLKLLINTFFFLL